MSVVVAVVKDGKATIAADSQTNFGSLTIGSEQIADSMKIFEVNGSYIGLVGWSATSIIMEHFFETIPEVFKLNSRMQIFSTFLKIQGKLRDDYFIYTNESDDDQPVASNQIDGLIVNENGIFSFGSYREVHEFKTFWSLGSGKQLALGAMHAMYNSGATSEEIAIAGVSAACDLEESCNFPVEHFTVELASS